MSDDDDDTLNNLMTFCIQLLHHSQCKPVRTFLCGSSMEIPISGVIHNRYHINEDMKDFDLIIYLTSQYAVNRSFDFPETHQVVL